MVRSAHQNEATTKKGVDCEHDLDKVSRFPNVCRGRFFSSHRRRGGMCFVDENEPGLNFTVVIPHRPPTMWDIKNTNFRT